jgi:hypothetical protein
MMSVAYAWKNRITLVLSLITLSFLLGCTTFQSQKTTETSVPVKQGEMKQISPEVREKIALEAQKAIPAKSPLELEKVTASVEEKPLKKETVPAVQYGKREGTIAGVKYRYEGDLLGNVYHGKGKLSYANGFSYEGEF